MNSRQREARRARPTLRWGHLTNQAIGYMKSVGDSYHLFIADDVKIKASQIDHATYKVIREKDGYLKEAKVLIDIPTEKISPGMFSIEEAE